jgi:hypothetical protein
MAQQRTNVIPSKIPREAASLKFSLHPLFDIITEKNGEFFFADLNLNSR